MYDKTEEFLNKNKNIVLDAIKKRENKDDTESNLAKEIYSIAINNSRKINDLLFSRVLKSFMKQYHNPTDILKEYASKILTKEEINKLDKTSLNINTFLRLCCDEYNKKYSIKGEKLALIMLGDRNCYIPFIYEKDLYESLGIEYKPWFDEKISSFNSSKKNFEEKSKELLTDENKEYRIGVLRPLLEVSKFFSERDKIENDFSALSKQNADLILSEVYKKIFELYKKNNLEGNESYSVRYDYVSFDKANKLFRLLFSNKIVNKFIGLNVDNSRLVDFYKCDNGSYLPIMYRDLFRSGDSIIVNGCSDCVEFYIYQKDLEKQILALEENNQRQLKQTLK